MRSNTARVIAVLAVLSVGPLIIMFGEDQAAARPPAGSCRCSCECCRSHRAAHVEPSSAPAFAPAPAARTRDMTEAERGRELLRVTRQDAQDYADSMNGFERSARLAEEGRRMREDTLERARAMDRAAKQRGYYEFDDGEVIIPAGD